MIEIPRAALTADEIAEVAEFFSFGTNDLTQMTFGYSRDDVNRLPARLRRDQEILPTTRSSRSTRPGVGQLVEMGVEKGRDQRPPQPQGRHLRRARRRPASIEVLPQDRPDYVSCSPFRVPIARLAAAQAALQS
jgi:pyruvate,orthophosphate dikinase